VTRDRTTGPEARPHRLFVAVEVSAEARRAVDEAVGPWRAAFPRARWVPEENWHVTVKFLGPTVARLLGWVPQAVASAAQTVAPFTAHLTSLGAFPSTGRARVLWAGVEDPGGQMHELARSLDASLSAEFRQESRPFHPHLTVARCDPPLAPPDGFAATELEPVAFRIGRVVVFESHPGRPAPRYEPLAARDLGG
jgi:2'-5' RNA ligase